MIRRELSDRGRSHRWGVAGDDLRLPVEIAIYIGVTVLVLLTAPRGRTGARTSPPRYSSRERTPRRRGWVRRHARALALAATLVALGGTAVGVTVSRESAGASSGPNTLHNGTAAITTPTNSACSMTHAAPGNTATCTLGVTYGGVDPVYLGLDVLIATAAGTGGSALYTPSDTTDDLQISVKDNQTSPVTYVSASPATSFGSAITCPNAYGGDTCYQLLDLLVRTTAFSSGSSITFTTTLAMPSSTNAYEGGLAYVALMVHAAQSANQPSVSGCSAGSACSPTGFRWS